MITLAKRAILAALAPAERRGLVFSMRRKLVPSEVADDIRQCRTRSFCPFAHFDTAWRALQHLEQHDIRGDVVLCGVSHGGLAKFLLKHMGPTRTLWLYDTFDGGTLPGPHDSAFDRQIGPLAKRVMAADFQRVYHYVNDGSGRCQWVVGDILKTIPRSAPSVIALLYLDTDWHDSTLHELQHLEPRVNKGGIIIQDDMGLCVGAARAVEDYYYVNDLDRPFIVPIDEAGCVWTKHTEWKGPRE